MVTGPIQHIHWMPLSQKRFIRDRLHLQFTPVYIILQLFLHDFKMTSSPQAIAFLCSLGHSVG